MDAFREKRTLRPQLSCPQMASGASYFHKSFMRAQKIWLLFLRGKNARCAPRWDAGGRYIPLSLAPNRRELRRHLTDGSDKLPPLSSAGTRSPLKLRQQGLTMHP